MDATQFALPPCTRQYGCCYCGPVDYCLSLGHAALTATFVATIVTGHSYLAIGIAIGEAALITSHVLYQKYGNIAKVIDVFKKGVNGLQGQVDETQKLLSASQKTAEEYKTENGNLAQQNTQLSLSITNLTTQVETIGKELAEFKTNNETLNKLNTEFKARISQAEQTVQQYKSGLSQFAKNNEQLGAELKQISITIPGLEKTETQLGSTVSAFDKDFSQFLNQMTQNQNLSKQIILSLQTQSKDLQAKISSLESGLNQLSKDESQLESGESKMQEEERGTDQELLQLRQANQALSTEIEQLKKEQSERNQEFDKLKTIIAAIHKEREQLSAAGDQVAQSLSKLQAGFVLDTETLATQNEQIKAQIQQIENL